MPKKACSKNILSWFSWFLATSLSLSGYFIGTSKHAVTWGIYDPLQTKTLFCLSVSWDHGCIRSPLSIYLFGRLFSIQRRENIYTDTCDMIWKNFKWREYRKLGKAKVKLNIVIQGHVLAVRSRAFLPVSVMSGSELSSSQHDETDSWSFIWIIWKWSSWSWKADLVSRWEGNFSKGYLLEKTETLL